MYHYKARAYSPSLGRFLQTDPIGYGDGLNLLSYVSNDPVNAVDPIGHCAIQNNGYWVVNDNNPRNRAWVSTGPPTTEGCDWDLSDVLLGDLVWNQSGPGAGNDGTPTSGEDPDDFDFLQVLCQGLAESKGPGALVGILAGGLAGSKLSELLGDNATAALNRFDQVFRKVEGNRYVPPSARRAVNARAGGVAGSAAVLILGLAFKDDIDAFFEGVTDMCVGVFRGEE